MADFIVYPAIDLRFGNVVRLQQGKAGKQTVYSNNAEAVAQKWIQEGAEWLHVVSLNGAFGEATQKNEEALEKILSSGSGRLKIQLGGGIRTLSEIEKVLSFGVSRVVLGTAVIENPDFGLEALKRFGSKKIAFAMDAVNQELMTLGWQSPSGVSMQSLAKTLADAGAQTLIYTNIQKDGMQTGVDWENAKRLADQTGLAVIASGGTAELADVARVRLAGLEGVIIGRALYEGNFSLKEALNVR
jgi:phosphoribosylformimino-5-aminoimidazole carboxamide ribotide isomerase